MRQSERYTTNEAVPPAKPFFSPTRMKATLVGLALGVVLFAAGDYVLVWGEVDKATNQGKQLATLEKENADLEALIGTPEAYEDFKKRCEAEQAEFDQALEAVPSEAELAAALTDLEKVMKGTGVDLVSFLPGKVVSANLAPATPAPAPPPGPAPAAQPANAPAPVTIQGREIDVVVRANFRSYQSLLNAMAGHPRVLTTEGFTMTSDPNAASYSLKSRMALRVYFKQIPPAALPPAK